MHHYSDDAAMLTARDGPEGGKSGRSVTDPYHARYPLLPSRGEGRRLVAEP